jgi:hypothetical protein
MENILSCSLIPCEMRLYFVPYDFLDRLCGLVVRVLGYISGGLGSIPGTTRKRKE